MAAGCEPEPSANGGKRTTRPSAKGGKRRTAPSGNGGNRQAETRQPEAAPLPKGENRQLTEQDRLARLHADAEEPRVPDARREADAALRALPEWRAAVQFKEWLDAVYPDEGSGP